jgi:hypothetical protein
MPTVTTLFRARWPETTRTADGAICSCRASRRTSASLAAPSIAGAVTRTSRMPSAAPRTSSAPLRGVSRTASRVSGIRYSWMIEMTFPAGSLNQAIGGPYSGFGGRMTPRASCSIPGYRSSSTPAAVS